MLNQLGIEVSEVPKMCLDLYKEYGTTMAGLKVSDFKILELPKLFLYTEPDKKTKTEACLQVLGYEFDNDEFHEYVHGRLPYEKLKPDPVLRNLLLSMPHRKIVSFFRLQGFFFSFSEFSTESFFHLLFFFSP